MSLNLPKMGLESPGKILEFHQRVDTMYTVYDFTGLTNNSAIFRYVHDDFLLLEAYLKSSKINIYVNIIVIILTSLLCIPEHVMLGAI
jgi:hypothetical protein